LNPETGRTYSGRFGAWELKVFCFVLERTKKGMEGTAGIFTMCLTTWKPELHTWLTLSSQNSFRGKVYTDKITSSEEVAMGCKWSGDALEEGSRVGPVLLRELGTLLTWFLGTPSNSLVPTVPGVPSLECSVEVGNCC
jgi:hypothetical protein